MVKYTEELRFVASLKFEHVHFLRDFSVQNSDLSLVACFDVQLFIYLLQESKYFQSLKKYFNFEFHFSSCNAIKENSYSVTYHSWTFSTPIKISLRDHFETTATIVRLINRELIFTKDSEKHFTEVNGTSSSHRTNQSLSTSSMLKKVLNFAHSLNVRLRKKNFKQESSYVLFCDDHRSWLYHQFERVSSRSHTNIYYCVSQNNFSDIFKLCGRISLHV